MPKRTWRHRRPRTSRRRRSRRFANGMLVTSTWEGERTGTETLWDRLDRRRILVDPRVRDALRDVSVVAFVAPELRAAGARPPPPRGGGAPPPRPPPPPPRRPRRGHGLGRG